MSLSIGILMHVYVVVIFADNNGDTLVVNDLNRLIRS